eukprot:403359153
MMQSADDAQNLLSLCDYPNFVNLRSSITPEYHQRMRLSSYDYNLGQNQLDQEQFVQGKDLYIDESSQSAFSDFEQEQVIMPSQNNNHGQISQQNLNRKHHANQTFANTIN